MMLPLLWPVGLALPGEQDRALHALGVSETANATSLPKLSKQACLDQLNSLPNALVEPESGLIWCPNSKAGTTTMSEILQNKLDPGAPCPLCNKKLWNTRDRLSPSAQAKCFDASAMSLDAKQAFCERGNALSFTILRNPWERTASCYLDKVAKGTIAPDWDTSHIMSFSQFVQWLSKNGDSAALDHHFMSWCAFACTCNVFATLLASERRTPHPDSAHHRSFRCGPIPHNYSLVGTAETLDDDLTTLLDALHWDQSLNTEQAHPSLEECKQNSKCRSTIEAQLGADAFAGMQSSGDLALKLYQHGSTPELDLIELVRRRYEGDVAAGGYSYPPRGE